MKKNTFIALAVVILVVLIIGGKWYMEREKDKQELIEIQTDLANYIYNNYRLYTKDKSEEKKIKEQYNHGEGSLTEKEYLDLIKKVRIYSDIEKIEFTNFSVTPMNTVEVYFKLNNVYEDSVSLDTVSAETDKLIYNIRTLSGEGSYYLDEKPEKTETSMPSKEIVYYYGTVN